MINIGTHDRLKKIWKMLTVGTVKFEFFFKKKMLAGPTRVLSRRHPRAFDIFISFFSLRSDIHVTHPHCFDLFHVVSHGDPHSWGCIICNRSVAKSWSPTTETEWWKLIQPSIVDAIITLSCILYSFTVDTSSHWGCSKNMYTHAAINEDPQKLFALHWPHLDFSRKKGSIENNAIRFFQFPNKRHKVINLCNLGEEDSYSRVASWRWKKL